MLINWKYCYDTNNGYFDKSEPGYKQTHKYKRHIVKKHLKEIGND